MLRLQLLSFLLFSFISFANQSEENGISDSADSCQNGNALAKLGESKDEDAKKLYRVLSHLAEEFKSKDFDPDKLITILNDRNTELRNPLDIRRNTANTLGDLNRMGFDSSNAVHSTLMKMNEYVRYLHTPKTRLGRLTKGVTRTASGLARRIPFANLIVSETKATFINETKSPTDIILSAIEEFEKSLKTLENTYTELRAKRLEFSRLAEEHHASGDYLDNELLKPLIKQIKDAPENSSLRFQLEEARIKLEKRLLSIRLLEQSYLDGVLKANVLASTVESLIETANVQCRTDLTQMLSQSFILDSAITTEKTRAFMEGVSKAASNINVQLSKMIVETGSKHLDTTAEMVGNNSTLDKNRAESRQMMDKHIEDTQRRINQITENRRIKLDRIREENLRLRDSPIVLRALSDNAFENDSNTINTETTALPAIEPTDNKPEDN